MPPAVSPKLSVKVLPMIVTGPMLLLLIAPPGLSGPAKLPVRVQWRIVRVLSLTMAPPPRGRPPIPPRRVSSFRVSEPAVATCMRWKKGSVKPRARSMMVLSAPAPVIVRGLVTTGRPVAPVVKSSLSTPGRV